MTASGLAASGAAAPSFKRLPRAVREQQMLDAAVRVFARRGFHAASMDEIAEDAGISKPMVYAYLGTKDELFLACLHREGTRVMEALVASVHPDLPPDEQMWHGLRAFFRYVGDNRDGWVVLFRQARGRSRAAGALAEMRGRIIEIVAGMLGRAVPPDGRPVRPGELTSAAYALVGAAESMADWLAAHPQAHPDKTAARMMNVAWLGAAQLLAGTVWRPAPDDG